MIIMFQIYHKIMARNLYSIIMNNIHANVGLQGSLNLQNINLVMQFAFT